MGDTFNEKHDKAFMRELKKQGRLAYKRARETGEEQKLQGIMLFGRSLWMKP